MSDFAAEPVRVVFFGTPDYAVPALQALAVDQRVEIVLVVTQPDRPAGRRRRLTSPAVKLAALARRIPVYQPELLRAEVDRQPIARSAPDLFVVAAFGKIFGPKLLALPRLGSVNLHASILPDYRGASPISAAILEGRLRTGVTLMRMDSGLDTGPILAQRSIEILPHDTTQSLTPRLASLGAELLIDSLDDLLSGRFQGEIQDDTKATLTRPMVKADGWVDWSRPAREIERQVRAMWDWPRAWTTLRGEILQIHRAGIRAGSVDAAPGTVVSASANGPMVVAGDGQLVIHIAQSAGGKPIPGAQWLRQSQALGERLGASGPPESPQVPLVRPVET